MQNSPRHRIVQKFKKQTSLSQLKKQNLQHSSSLLKDNPKKEYNIGNQPQSKIVKQKIFDLHDRVIYEAMKANDWNTALPLLNESQKKIHDLKYGGNKKLQFYHLSVLDQKVLIEKLRKGGEDSEMCWKFMEKSISNMEFAQAYSHSRQENIAFNYQIVKLQLKLGVLLSEVTKHEESVIHIERALQRLVDSFRMMLAICHQSLEQESGSLSSTKESSLAYSHVNFERIVLEDAQTTLQQLIDLPTSYKLVAQSRQYFQTIIKNIYCWKNNVNNNQKFLRKQLLIDNKDINSPRNLLGVQKTSWLEDYNIGMIVALKPRKLKKQFNCEKYYLLSQPKILQLILYASTCYFSIATENRFREEIISQSELIKSDKKYNNLAHQQTILKCKILHLKAIELAGHYLPYQSIFVQHLINSFNKHYKSVLDEIVQQIAQQSTLKLILHQQHLTIKNKEQEEQCLENQLPIAYDYGIRPNIKKRKKQRSRRNSTDQVSPSLKRKSRAISVKKVNK